MGRKAAAEGVPVAFMKNLVDYWLDDYSWQQHSSALNSYRHEVHPVRGKELHCVHKRGASSSSAPKTNTVMLLHGWTASFMRYLLVILHLVPARFNVVIPSLPGFVFSQPLEEQSVAAIAAHLNALMVGLGFMRHTRFTGGGDWAPPLGNRWRCSTPPRK